MSGIGRMRAAAVLVGAVVVAGWQVGAGAEEPPRKKYDVQGKTVANVGRPWRPFLVDTTFDLRIRRGDVEVSFQGVRTDAPGVQVEDGPLEREILILENPPLRWDGETLEWKGKKHDTSRFGTYLVDGDEVRASRVISRYTNVGKKVFPGGGFRHGPGAPDYLYECDEEGNVTARMAGRTFRVPRGGAFIEREDHDLRGDGWHLTWKPCPKPAPAAKGPFGGPAAGEPLDDVTFNGKIFELPRAGTFTADARTGKLTDAAGKELAPVEAH